MIKSTASPNKPNSSPVAERKVTETVDEASEGSSQGDFNRLCSDREPSKQVVGRLELALGSIIKEIKAADPDLIKSASVLREIKTVVRERIREVMMNRPVNTADAVKAQYRQVYNTQSDVELVANAIYAHSPKLGLIEIGNANLLIILNNNSTFIITCIKVDTLRELSAITIICLNIYNTL